MLSVLFEGRFLFDFVLKTVPSFNSKYLLDITNQIQGDKIYFSLSDSSSPALITDEQQEGTIFVLMPMRV